MLVGVTISLFILAGAASVATSQVGDHRRLLLDAQVQQDLRLTMDLITRDLRRAAYWGRANNAIWSPSWTTSMGNPYTAFAPLNSSTGSTQVTFQRSTDEVTGALLASENNIVDAGEYGGFKYVEGSHTIEVLVSNGNWQTLTDPEMIKITQFAVRTSSQKVNVPCGAGPCSASNTVIGPGGCKLVQVMRNATIEIAAEATNDSSIKRSLSSKVHLRNDLIEESC